MNTQKYCIYFITFQNNIIKITINKIMKRWKKI